MNIWSILEDRYGVLWIATQGGGLNRYNREKNSFDHFTYDANSADSISSDVIWTLFEDSQGELWVGTQEGLNKFNRQTETFRRYKNIQGDSSSLSHNRVMALFEDDAKNLWIGTRGGLNHWNRKTQKFTAYREDDGLASDVIQGVLQSQQGELWLSTSNGLSRFNTKTKQVRNYDSSNWLPGNHFNIGAFMQGRNGTLYFGSTKGFTKFVPEQVQDNQRLPPIVITDFSIFNKPVPIGEHQSPLHKAILETDALALNHKQSVFTLTFAALDFRAPEKNQYAYKLIGFDTHWNFVGNKRTASYTNLDPGEYTFKVKASNNEGLWNETGRSLSITILPPPWRSWWAYSIYCLLIAASILLFIRSQQRKVIEEQAANRKLEQKVAERTQELEQKNQELIEFGEKLEELSLSDPLTGLRNRRFLSKTIPTDISKILRQYSHSNAKAELRNNDIIFFMLDIDHFKSINDNHGHSAGDQILKQLGDLLRKTCRQSDHLVRWGGEEFLIAGRFSSRHEAPQQAERIRQTIENHSFTFEKNKVLQVSCSIGFACFPFLQGHPDLLNWEQVVNIADHALYQAKSSGRNRWIGIESYFNDSEIAPSPSLFEDIGALIQNDKLKLLSKAI